MTELDPKYKKAVVVSSRLRADTKSMMMSGTPKMTMRDALGPGFQLSGTSERTMRTVMQLVDPRAATTTSA